MLEAAVPQVTAREKMHRPGTQFSKYLHSYVAPRGEGHELGRTLHVVTCSNNTDLTASLRPRWNRHWLVNSQKTPSGNSSDRFDTEVLRQRARSNLVKLHVTKSLLDETDLNDACVLNPCFLNIRVGQEGGGWWRGEENKRDRGSESSAVML